MQENISVQRRNKISFTAGDDRQSVEFGSSAIDNGLLKKFPDSTLAIFLYLLTHLEDNQTVQTNATIIASYLPDRYNIESINKDLNKLAEKGIINISATRDGDYTYEISVNLEKVCSGDPAGLNNKNKNDYSATPGVRQLVLEKTSPSREELGAALMTFFPSGSDSTRVREWLDDFEPAVIQELIRRVDKWQRKNQNSREKGAAYLQGIVDDWYQKEVFSYKRLQFFDKLYRETKILAADYGIKDWHNLNQTQLETFQSWLRGDFPLSITVARLAIEEAIRRKKDGQPSLKYIEDNFIRPWKKAKIKNISEARTFLKSSSQTANNFSGNRYRRKDNYSTPSIKDWEELDWDRGIR